MEIKKKLEVSALKEIKHILVVGLGKSGLACVNYLTKQIKFKKTKISSQVRKNINSFIIKKLN